MAFSQENRLSHLFTAAVAGCKKHPILATDLIHANHNIELSLESRGSSNCIFIYGMNSSWLWKDALFAHGGRLARYTCKGSNWALYSILDWLESWGWLTSVLRYAQSTQVCNVEAHPCAGFYSLIPFAIDVYPRTPISLCHRLSC